MVRALNAPSASTQLGLGSMLIVETGILLWVGIGLLARQLRNGVVAAGSRETARRPPGHSRTFALDAPSRPLFGTVVQRRELRLLSRDRAFLVQTLVLPVVIVLSQSSSKAACMTSRSPA